MAYLAGYLFALHLACFSAANCANIESLKGLILLVNRGFTSLSTSYPNDLYLDLAYWPDGFDQLTIDGKNQMFMLGQSLSDRYSSFIPQNPHEILIRSLDDDSCLESSVSLAAGAFPPKGRWQWRENLTWQPMAVHSVARQDDQALGVRIPCPALEDRLRAIKLTQGLASQHSNIMSIIEEETGFEEANISAVKIVHQALSTEMAALLPLPSWMNESLMGQLNQLALESEYLINSDETVKNILSGPLLALIQSYTEGIVKGHQEKVYILTMKQEKLLSFLVTAGLRSGNWSQAKILPAPGDCLALEIHKDPFEGLFFSVFYYSQNAQEPESPGEWYQLQFLNCSDHCSLEFLERLIERYRTKDEASDVCSSPSPLPYHSRPSPPPPSSDHRFHDEAPFHRDQDKIAAMLKSSSFPSQIYSEPSSAWNVFMVGILCIAAAIIILLGIGMLMNRPGLRNRNDYDYL